MANNTLIGRVHMDCPICKMFHEVEERERMVSVMMKGEKVFYEEHFYVCTNRYKENGETTGGEFKNGEFKNGESKNSEFKNGESKNDGFENYEFQTADLMSDNQMAARNAYRKVHGLLTSDEIVAVRENYGLTQVEAARLLGWGEATIARYESKAIQDEAYDTMLRILKEDPFRAIALLDKNSDRFPEAKKMQIRTKMVEKLDSYGKEFLSRQVFASEYVKFSVPSDFNGYKLLDIDKVESVVSYFAERIADLYKIRLMNLLWYADAVYFKTCSNSMTGLVYRHEPMGVLPVGNVSLTNLKNINVHVEEDHVAAKYHFYPNTALQTTELSKNETTVLDSVITRFRNYDDPLLVSCIQEETAYTQTTPGAIIPYSLAKKMRAF
ncbi:MAG: DUF4065 domain-containing protein [Lachnospiraceae bacterium]|nr:DUF4065 domain-containing protein [Lachnospiraceae bacterium]